MPISRGITHSVGALVIVCHWCATACSHRISSQTRGGCWWLSERLGVRYGVCVSSLTEIQSFSSGLLARLSGSRGGVWLRRRVLYRPLFSRSRLNRLLNQAQRFKNPLVCLEDCSSEVAPKRRIFFKTLLELRVGVVVLEVRVVSAVELPVVGLVVLEGRGVCLVDRPPLS